MKNLKLLVVALVAMFGFIACDKHECNDYDHSADIVGTWTCLQAGYAEALVIKADGSAVSTGYDGTEYWENVAGNIVVKNGIATMTFEDGDNFEGHIDVIAGMAFSTHDCVLALSLCLSECEAVVFECLDELAIYSNV